MAKAPRTELMRRTSGATTKVARREVPQPEKEFLVRYVQAQHGGDAYQQGARESFEEALDFGRVEDGRRGSLGPK